ncbi:hypothetical protein SDC9_164395 [bioreactor metagenome]|uniref:Uncharacterized protein n=1 Tax=bioreactor metagenome TaxID=1076179 RepID=A0A645FTH7_9ZZZZ
MTGRELCVNLEAFALFDFIQNVFKFVFVNFLHNIAEHLDKTTVAVIGKTFIGCLFSQTYNGFIIKAKV